MIAAQTTGTAGLDAIRVLIVDDQDYVRRWTRRILHRMGVHRVAEACDGSDALTRVTEPGAVFDLVLCDLKMPNADGIELIRSFASLRMRAAVVLVSMEPERVLETSVLLAEEQGLRVLGAIAKPVTEDKLMPMLVAAMRVAGTPARPMPAVSRDAVRGALMSGALHLLYQPKIVMATRRISGVEALARWQHPDFGTVGPDDFISLCEESDLLGSWLLDFTLNTSLAFAARWCEADPSFTVALNVHAHAFDDVALPERIEAAARRHGVRPGQVTLEVTERSVARDPVRMLEVATRLRLKEFSLAIDDFGTGHSGLTLLRRLPFNELKIDRQFVDGAADSSTKRSVVEASVALAKSLAMRSVAEGIQQRADWDLMQQIGCDEMQGYFTARPMTEEALHDWAARWNRSQQVAAASRT